MITLAESPAAGQARLQFSAAHATSFQVWHKGASDAAFTLAATVLLPGDYATAGLPAGAHHYQVVGVNSRGEGVASEPAAINVPVAAAA